MGHTPSPCPAKDFAEVGDVDAVGANHIEYVLLPFDRWKWEMVVYEGRRTVGVGWVEMW